MPVLSIPIKCKYSDFQSQMRSILKGRDRFFENQMVYEKDVSDACFASDRIMHVLNDQCLSYVLSRILLDSDCDRSE
jgi:hypothetical protein